MSQERKLASIQRINDVLPHPNADNLELATVLGWQTIVKKGEFRPGDLAVFCEVDSVLPECEWSEFLRKDKFRIRTIKLRGELSQGIVFPLSTLGECNCEDADDGPFVDCPYRLDVGEDVTELLGVTKYEQPTVSHTGGWGFNSGVGGRPFPEFVPKTDEIRIQSAPELIDCLRGKAYVATLKLDGTSATYVLDPQENKPLVCSRNRVVEDTDSVYWKIGEKYNLFRRVQEWPNYAFQGEIMGPGIQGNKLNLKEHEFFLFTIYNTRTGKYEQQDTVEWAAINLGLKFAPVIERGNWFNHTKEECLVLAEGEYEGTNNHREGLVWRSAVEEWVDTHNHKGRLSFKTINNNYLLKEEKG